jgi:hypothetical protein
MPRIKPVEPRRSFSIYLPNSLYQKIESKAGRGRVNTFITQVLEKELVSGEEQLVLAHKRVAKNQKLKKELEVWDETVDDYANKR